MVLELCWICSNLRDLSVLLHPELPELLVLLVLWHGHVLRCLVHAGSWSTILHSLMHLHHALHASAQSVMVHALPRPVPLSARCQGLLRPRKRCHPMSSSHEYGRR